MTRGISVVTARHGLFDSSVIASPSSRKPRRADKSRCSSVEQMVCAYLHTSNTLHLLSDIGSPDSIVHGTSRLLLVARKMFLLHRNKALIQSSLRSRRAPCWHELSQYSCPSCNSMPVLPPVPQALAVPSRLAPASLSAPHTPEVLIAHADKHCALLPARPDLLRPRPDGKDVVLVTGTTGNFGCVLLEALLENPGISLVYAVNRRGSRSRERQRASFRARELDEDLLDSDKLRFVEAELGIPGLGLDEELLDEVSCGRHATLLMLMGPQIRGSVSHIIHNGEYLLAC